MSFEVMVCVEFMEPESQNDGRMARKTFPLFKGDFEDMLIFMEKLDKYLIRKAQASWESESVEWDTVNDVGSPVEALGETFAVGDDPNE